MTVATKFEINLTPKGSLHRLNPTDLAIAQRLKGQLQAALPLHALYVFGSRARGDHQPDSDMDVFVILDQLDRTTEHLLDDIAWQVGYDCERVITTIATTPAQLQHSALQASPFIVNLKQEGVQI